MKLNRESAGDPEVRELRAEVVALRLALATAQVALLFSVGHARSLRIDPLTGLPTRDFFTAMTNPRLSPGCALGLLDIDNFKGLNDVHGHAEGDVGLAAYGARMRAWHGRDAIWGRLHGDEFAVLLDVTDPGWRGDLSDLIEILAQPITLDTGETVRLTASLGVARCVLGIGFSATLRAADAAMYRAKSFGGNRWTLYDPLEDGDLSLPAPRTRSSAGSRGLRAAIDPIDARTR